MKFIKHVRSRLLKLPIFDLHSHLGDSFQIVVKPTTFPKFNNQFIKKRAIQWLHKTGKC